MPVMAQTGRYHKLSLHSCTTVRPHLLQIFVQICTEYYLFNSANARHNGLGMMAAFLRLFAKMVTACPNPLDGDCYTLLICSWPEYSTIFTIDYDRVLFNISESCVDRFYNVIIFIVRIYLLLKLTIALY